MSSYLNQSASHWSAFRNTRFSICLSVSFVLLCDMISPAGLNSLTTAALTGNGALSFTNKVVNVLKFVTGCVLCTKAAVRYYL